MTFKEITKARRRTVGIMLKKYALKMGVKPVSLGKRILRTETAGPAILALLMMKLEGAF